MFEHESKMCKTICQNSVYLGRSHQLNAAGFRFAKFRKEQIKNEFQHIDVHGRGKLTRAQIINHLQKKYQSVNRKILDEIFNKIDWGNNDSVSTEQFCIAYLERERFLFYQISREHARMKRKSTLQLIYKDCLTDKPKVFATLKIKQAHILYKGVREQFANLTIEYQNHSKKISYQIIQHCCELNRPSLQIFLPAQGSHLFVKYLFHNPFNLNQLFGSTYLQIEFNQEMRARNTQKLTIYNGNNDIGFCFVQIQLQQNEQIVKSYLKENAVKNQQVLQHSQFVRKQQQYEYLQFLWGIRHKPSAKVSQLNVKTMVVTRIIFIVLLSALSIFINPMGRCEPFSFIIPILIAKDWKYAMFRRDKLILVVMALAGMLLNFGWLVFKETTSSMLSLMTYILLAVEGILFLYLILFQSSLN